jgi:hypothetical protein
MKTRKSERTVDSQDYGGAQSAPNASGLKARSEERWSSSCRQGFDRAGVEQGREPVGDDESAGDAPGSLGHIVQNSTYASQALAYIVKQNATILCELGQISNNTCGILNQTTEQTRIQHRIAHAAVHLKDLLDSVYAAEAINL